MLLIFFKFELTRDIYNKNNEQKKKRIMYSQSHMVIESAAGGT